MTDQPTGELRIRQATQVGVDYPKRIIELIVAPWEEQTIVNQPYGRPVMEMFMRGAFDGIQRRPNRIKALRDHAAERVVGKAVALYPSRTEGLVAELRIAKTELGDETLALAEEEILDASAGFLPMPDGEDWNPERSEVKITKAWLGHVGLVAEPAYEGARVLSVREKGSQDATRPNLELVRAWRLQDEYDRLTKAL